MKNIFYTALIIFSLVMLPIAASAQVAAGGNFTLEQSVIAGGGGQNTTGGQFALDGTIGQSLAGNALEGSPFAVTSGFWNFTPSAALYTISGNIIRDGLALAGVSVALSGSATNTTTTDSSGNYSFSVNGGGNYTITPSLAGYTFTPPNASFINITANQTANFVATVSCLQSLNPTNVFVGSSAATGSIAVTAPAGCNWTAVSNAAWITITAGSIGSGNGTVSYSVTANAGAQRTGTITIGGQTFTVNQAAGGSLSIFGLVSYGTTPVGQPTKYVAGVNLNATGASSASTVTDSTGNYQLSGLLSGGNYTVTPAKTGDVNSISSFDASLVARRAANLISLTANQMIAADASNNGTVSSFDASLIARTAAGIANTGIAGQWKFVPASRSYPSLTADQTNQNYEAILMGEVSGNWTPPTAPVANRPLIDNAVESDKDEESSYQFSKADPSLELNQSTRQSKVLATDAPKVSIDVSLLADSTAATGRTVLIPITVEDTTGQGIFAYDFSVSFNPNVLQPDLSAFDATDSLSGAANFTITPNAGESGRVHISGFSSNQPLSGAGTLIYLRFRVVGPAGEQTDSANLRFDSFIFNEG